MLVLIKLVSSFGWFTMQTVQVIFLMELKKSLLSASAIKNAFEENITVNDAEKTITIQ